MRGFSQLEARQRLGIQRVRPFVVLQLRPNLMSLSHSAVRFSLPCVEKLPRRRDWKNVAHALEPASPAIAPARPLLPHSAPPPRLSPLPRGRDQVPPRSTVLSGTVYLLVERLVLTGCHRGDKFTLQYGSFAEHDGGVFYEWRAR